MIVDTSAIMALLLEEAERDVFLVAIANAGSRLMSAGSWIELGAVLARRADNLSPKAKAILVETRITLAPVTPAQAELGFQAYRNFGKGLHRARLNLGDCFSYALAKDTGLPLLFKGDDFTHTDIAAAI